MPGEDTFWSDYPAIMQMTIHDVERNSTDPKARRSWLEVYRDLERARARPGVVGWKHTRNPFVLSGLSSDVPDPLTPWQKDQYKFTLHANAWFGIGVWSLAEEYYRLVIDMASCKRDGISVLQNAATLGLCYLGAKDYVSSARINQHVFEVAIKLEGYCYTVVAPQASTQLRLTLLASGQAERLSMVNSQIRQLDPKLAQVDPSVHSMLASVFRATNDTMGLQEWDSLFARLN